ncbi:hypothetical protein OKW96_17860 [Sphingobacterium sp. KU25419]|nr:hypothetical protein OKW96_17860 [Sphingobacterium sp. KU25419]
MKSRLTLVMSISFLFFITELRAQSQYLVIPDERDRETIPTDYNRVLKSEFKFANKIGLPLTGFVYTMGLRGWSDDSGGPAHELAFSPTKLYLRSGTNAAGWQVWRELLISNTAGNYGIGTETPGEKLDIANGYLKIGNTSYGNYEQSSPRNYSTLEETATDH